MTKREIIGKYYPQLAEEELLDEIDEVGVLKTLRAGEALIDMGQYIKTIPLVYEGKIKIFREDEEGNELFLYYLYPGEPCALSLVCSTSDKMSQVRAMTTEETKLLALPVQYMNEFMAKYPSWYRFVVGTYSARMEEMLNTIDSIAFHKMDERLLEYLDKTVQANGNRFIKGTHQEIAYELNTSREVISRLLKQLEKKGLIKLSRNLIEVVH